VPPIVQLTENSRNVTFVDSVYDTEDRVVETPTPYERRRESN